MKYLGQGTNKQQYASSYLQSLLCRSLQKLMQAHQTIKFTSSQLIRSLYFQRNTEFICFFYPKQILILPKMGCGQSNAAVFPIQRIQPQIIAPKSIQPPPQPKKTIKLRQITVKLQPLQNDSHNKENQAVQPIQQNKPTQNNINQPQQIVEHKSLERLKTQPISEVCVETIALSPSTILCRKVEEKDAKKQRKNKRKKKQKDIQPIQKQLKRLYGL